MKHAYVSSYSTLLENLAQTVFIQSLKSIKTRVGWDTTLDSRRARAYARGVNVAITLWAIKGTVSEGKRGGVNADI